jgi:hypothetical protein
MADPFSIITGAITVVEVSFRVVRHLHRLRQDLIGIASELDGLAEELETIRDLCGVVQSTFVARADDASKSDLWRHLGRALENCRGVLTQLDYVVSIIERPSGLLV